MSKRNVVRPNKTSFRFESNEVVTLKDSPVEQVLEAVRAKQQSIHFEPLEGATIDPTGMIERGGLRFSHYGFGRLCRSLEMPRRFIDEISKYNPTLAATVINDVVQRKSRKYQLAIDGDVVEGVITDQFSRLENQKVAEIVAEITGIDVFSKVRLEGLRMRLNHVGDMEDMRKHVKERVAEGSLKQGDMIGGGLDIYNGEDGGTSFSIGAYIYRLLCENGMIGPDPKGPGGGGKARRLIHRGSGLKERAMVLIQHSQDICGAYLDKLPQAVGLELNVLEQRVILERLQHEFSMVFANSVMESAVGEALSEGHPDAVTLYNMFNGVTVQAHEVRSIDRQRHIETFAAKVLDMGLKNAAA